MERMRALWRRHLDTRRGGNTAPTLSTRELAWMGAYANVDDAPFSHISLELEVADRLEEVRVSNQTRMASESSEAKKVRMEAEAKDAAEREGRCSRARRAKDPLRTEQTGLPPHLRLGLTLSGMHELCCSLPIHAVKQANAARPRDEKTGQPKFPASKDLNGYVNQFFITKAAEKDGLSVCERLQKEGSAHVGEANVFVSWSLSTSIHALLDALAHFLLQQGLPEATTKFWVCDFVIRQTDVKADLEWLGPCVEAIGHTVLLMQPWRDPEPLRRAYCIKEVYHTQVGRARFDVTMSTYQQIDFQGALLGDEGGAIMTALSQIDVQQVCTRTLLCSPLLASVPLQAP